MIWFKLVGFDNIITILNYKLRAEIARRHWYYQDLIIKYYTRKVFGEHYKHKVSFVKPLS